MDATDIPSDQVQVQLEDKTKGDDEFYGVEMVQIYPDNSILVKTTESEVYYQAYSVTSFVAGESVDVSKLMGDTYE